MSFIKDKTLGLFVKTNGVISKQIFGGLGIVFMLHRVLPEKLRDEYTINKDLAITPEHLEAIITYLIKQGYSFISLDELYDIIVHRKQSTEKLICITLDDGYRDNMLYGLPVFKKYNVPVTIYVTNCFPNQTALYWWYLLENRIHTNDHLKIETAELTKEYRWKDVSQGISLFPEMRNLIKSLPKAIFTETVKKSFEISDEQLREQCRILALSWEEVRQLSNEKGVTIGAHTMNHLSLKTLTDDELTYELSASKNELEEKTGKKVEHFAYPYGGFDDAYSREYAAVKNAGFKTATINHRGNISYGQSRYMECIPRMPLGENTSIEKINFMLNGIDHFSYNGFVRNITY